MIKNRKKFGKAFKDEVIKVNRASGHFAVKKESSSSWQDLLLPNFHTHLESFQPFSIWRIVLFSCLILIIFFGLFMRLFHLQVVLGSYHRELADSNRVQIKIIHAPRGVIYDRNGKVLAESNPGFRVGKEFITRDQALELEAKDDPKFHELEVDTIRHYPQSESVSHILGYVGQITDEELKGESFKSYRIGDRLGRAGIEQVYEEYLRGKDGADIVEIDAQGKKLRVLRTINPIPGQNVHLTIDADLQKITYEALKKGTEGAKSCCGAAVIQHPKTGEILSMVSYPSFDGNAFTDPTRSESLKEYFSSSTSPLLNRAIGGTYPPGSTFKITSALAGLETGKINKDTNIEDTGVVFLGPYRFANWFFTQHGKTDGFVDVPKALQRSNDIFFYRVGEMVGVDGIGQTAKKMGFGSKTGIDLPNEEAGLIPNNDWKMNTFNEQWYPGDDLHLAIGQGFLLTTPLQVLVQTSVIANEGQRLTPFLASHITSPGGATVQTLKNSNDKKAEQVTDNKEHLALIKHGLELVPKAGGTAWPFFNFAIETAGKTGTAEYGDPKGNTHAWYTAYAPVTDPHIAITVLLESGGEGSSIASPIAKEILNWYFNTDKAHIQKLETVPQATPSAIPDGD